MTNQEDFFDREVRELASQMAKKSALNIEPFEWTRSNILEKQSPTGDLPFIDTEFKHVTDINCRLDFQEKIIFYNKKINCLDESIRSVFCIIRATWDNKRPSWREFNIYFSKSN